MKTKLVLAVIFVISVAGVLAGIKILQFKQMAGNAGASSPPPETVSSVEAAVQHWENALVAIGSIRAAQGVRVSAEVAGVIQDLKIDSGAHVEKGAVLVQLDTSTEQAQLRAVEAELEHAKINLSRVEKLRADQTVSVSELDAARTAMDQTRANADAIRTAIEKKTIRSPFAGVLGLRQVDLGQYVDAGHVIVSLQALSPVYADFSLPQQELARLKAGMKVRVTTDAYKGREFEGLLTAINPDLDAATRSVPLRATLENAQELLRPGMFARIEVLLPEEEDVLAVPMTAVLSAPFGDSVFIIESTTGTNGTERLTVRQQFIRTGRERGDFVAVQSGLKPGERIVNSGLFKLRNGMAVVENNAIMPPASTKPTPADS
jgi:membrane fusion protein, multidrug efflux system